MKASKEFFCPAGQTACPSYQIHSGDLVILRTHEFFYVIRLLGRFELQFPIFWKGVDIQIFGDITVKDL